MYGFVINCEGNAIDQMKAIESHLSSLGVKATIETKEVGSAFAVMGEKVQGALGGIKSLLIGGLGIGALMEGFTFIKDSKEAFDKLENSVAQVEASLKSTKEAAGMTFDDVNKSARELSKNTLFGRSSILDMQSVLLTFPSITKEVFPSASAAILDMATKLKTGPTEAAIQLGKALQDPEKGISALHRVGVNTDELKKKFETVTDTLTRQKLIIAELNTEFGGSAKAAAGTDEGKIEMAKKQWGEIKLTIGEIVSKLQVAMIPILTAVTTSLKAIIAFFKSSSTEALIFKDTLLAIAAALAIYGTYLAIVAGYTSIVTAATWLWNAALAANPIVWLIAAIVGLVAALMMCWDKFEGFRKFMGGLWGGIQQAVMTIVHAFMNLGTVIDDVFHGRFKKALEDGKKLISDYGKDITTGMSDAIKKGSEAAGKSEFKFSNLLKFADKKEGGPSKEFGKGASGTGLKDSAINTSNLSGASGGLGQAKTVNIHIDTVQKIYGVVSKELKTQGQNAAEMIIRTANNLQGGQSM